MALLAGKLYDPSTAATASCGTLLAMTAIDTTNLRLTFTAPANGCVMVRLRCPIDGATTWPSILLGILSGSTVIARQSPMGVIAGTAISTTTVVHEALFTISGLTAGNSYTWDAAYGVETILSSTYIRYGGPNTASASVWGGFQFEIWEATALLGSKLYDPSTAATESCASLLAMTAMDTTNLRITFTAPLSGRVLVRMMGTIHGATTFPQVIFGVLQSSTVIGRTNPIGGLKNTALATAQLTRESQFVVTGLTPGNNYTWDAAYAVQVAVTSTGIKYGGPNNTTANDAFGAFLFEIWSC